jgi:protein required for attachment to host cells
VSICILVADSARARFLMFTPAETPDQARQPLLEFKDLVNPEADAYGRDLWSDTKTGLGRAPSGQQAHSYDDHREQHEAEFVRRFAKKIAAEAQALVQSQKASTLVIAAPNKMLGFLRSALDQGLKSDVAVQEVAKDLTKLNAVELHEHLAEAKILPPYQPPRLQPGARSASKP